MSKDIKKVSYKKFKRIILSDVKTGIYYCRRGKSYYTYLPEKESIHGFKEEMECLGYLTKVKS